MSAVNLLILLVTSQLVTHAKHLPAQPSCYNEADFCEDPVAYPIPQDLILQVLFKRRVRRNIQNQVI